MNLHAIASPATGLVNPLVKVAVQVSNGPAPTNPDGSRAPQYAPAFIATADVQQLSTSDLRHLEGLNIQGSMRKIYLNGEVDAIVRVNEKGGDIITLDDNTVWLTTRVIERWRDWVAVAVTLQNQKQGIGTPTSMWTHQGAAPVGGAAIGEQ